MAEHPHTVVEHLGQLIEVAVYSCIPAALAAWRDIVDELDRPRVDAEPTGHVFRFRRWRRRRVRRLVLRGTVVCTGALVGGVLCAEIVIAAGASEFERAALILGGIGGWRWVDRWRTVAEARFLERVGQRPTARRDDAR